MNKNFVSNSNYIIRKILNKEENLDIIKNLIEAFLSIHIKQIQLNKYLKNIEKYLPKEENFGVCDVRIITSDNIELNVGIQFIDGQYIESKLLMFYSQIHLNQILHDKNRRMAKTITINFLDFLYYPSQEYHKVEKTINAKNEEIEIHIVELPKLNIINEYFKQCESPNFNVTVEQQWILYLRDGNKSMVNYIKSKNENIKKLDLLVEEYWKNEKMA